MISKEVKKELRKLLRKDYPTSDDVVRVADDIDLSIEGVNVKANINTVWDDVLDKASSEKEKWNALVALFKDEMDEEVINVILNNNISTNDEKPSTGVKKAIGGIIKEESKEDSKQKPIYKNHLLVIGINDYENGIPILNNAYPDAQRFYKVLMDKYQFDETTSIFLENKSKRRLSKP